MFLELTYSELMAIDGGIDWWMVVGGSIAIVGGIIVCATGAGALAGAVTIYIGLMTVVQCLES
ncbi:MAG: class IIb bacteriocin, lactobin A/cerein 7B family [Bacillota bacterium]|nr:class IIb bacteriocin, lactobin A/cerein 7B family [Clostridia bacterium]